MSAHYFLTIEFLIVVCQTYLCKSIRQTTIVDENTLALERPKNTKTRAIKARVETHTLTFAYVIAQQARGLPGPGRHQKRVPEPPEREQHQGRVRELLVPERRQAQAQVQRRKAAAQPCRWHTWAVLAREQQCW